MRQEGVLKLVSGVLHLVTVLAITIAYLSVHDWFGKGDTYAFLFWTVPLAIGISLSGPSFLNAFKPTNFVVRLIFIIVIAVLISFGWLWVVYLILGPWSNTFSFPIFYLWIPGIFIQLLFLDRMVPRSPSRRTTIFMILSFPVILLASVVGMYFLSFASSFINRPEKETYLIPEDFNGEFRVVYGEKCGVVPRSEEGRRVLEIPLNGVLIIQPEFEAGIIDNEYYLVDHDGLRTVLSSSFGNDSDKDTMPGITMGGSGNFGGPMPDGGFSSESELAIEFTDFTVFNGDTTTVDERLSFKRHQKFDSLTQALVEACRKSAANGIR
jgi:hypothetical protein